VDNTLVENSVSQTCTMGERTPYPRFREFFQMLARFRKTRAAQENRADPEFTINEVTEWNSGGHHVAAGIRRLDPNSRLVSCRVEPATEERLDCLYLDQCDVVSPRDRLGGKKSGPGEIPITFEAAPRNGPHFRNRPHRSRSLRRDMNGALVRGFTVGL
jgi:hypothetical protein